MLKKVLLSTALFALVGILSAQSLQFEYDGTVYANNEVVLCEAAPNSIGEMVMEMQLRNLTSEALQVIVEKEYIDIVEGTSNSFCWGLCFDESVFISPRPYELEAGAVSEHGILSFHYQLDPTYSGTDLLVGTTIIKYYAYPASNPDDKTCIEVHFRYNPENVAENNVQIGKAYPNPASTQIQFDFKGQLHNNIKAVVYNLLGQEVKSTIVNGVQGKVVITLDDFQSGIYFCSFFMDGEMVKTEKFIVKK
ncbi:MAG: T9SS type A sorting domain-containing protein [Bacteroidales bacterium]|nr:T9SS type A sorting domain-containing protein [Bacteroidales bacterium]